MPTTRLDINIADGSYSSDVTMEESKDGLYCVYSDYEELEKRNDELADEKEELEKEVKGLKDDIENLNNHIREIEAELERANNTIQELEAQMPSV